MNARLPARHGKDYDVELAGLASAYPSLVVDNAAFVARAQFDVGDAAAVARLADETGLRARRWCGPNETAWTLARDAALAAVASSGCASSIDLVLVASGTTTPVQHPADAELPGMSDLAPRLVHALGRDGALGIDLKACYCTGFLRGLEVADALLANRSYRAALVVAAEQGSRLATAASNRSAFCFLMADGAGAAVLIRREGRSPNARGVLDYVNATEGDKLDWIAVGDDGASMRVRGAKAGEATVELLVRAGRELLSRNGLTPRDIAWLLPVQSHLRVVSAAREALEFPTEKLLFFAEDLGFSGSASVPATLADARASGRVKQGDLVLALAVGAGLSWGGALLRA
jgi:3-oxoacyl-[acyl-carrier-protein] synthase-3